MSEEIKFNDDQVFTTKAGLRFPGFTESTLKDMRSALRKELFISEIQTCEAASYSLAMVVRFALGLSAEGGAVVAVVDDCLAGQIVLGTVRHLRNAGAVCDVVCLNDPNESSGTFSQLLKPLEIMKVEIKQLGSGYSIQDMSARAADSHNVLHGLFGSSHPEVGNVSEALNELSTPIHTIDCPTGIDPDTGQSIKSPLFASSTLSLGAPLQGLNKGRDYVGRHYLCDISIPREVYLRGGFDLAPLFAEQPVVQILPYSPEEEEKSE